MINILSPDSELLLRSPLSPLIYRENFPKHILSAHMIALKTENLKEKEKRGTEEAKIL